MGHNIKSKRELIRKRADASVPPSGASVPPADASATHPPTRASPHPPTRAPPTADASVPPAGAGCERTLLPPTRASPPPTRAPPTRRRERFFVGGGGSHGLEYFWALRKLQKILMPGAPPTKYLVQGSILKDLPVSRYSNSFIFLLSLSKSCLPTSEIFHKCYVMCRKTLKNVYLARYILQKYYHNRETLLKLYSTCVTVQKTYTKNKH